MRVSWLLLPVLLQTGCISNEDPVNEDAAGGTTHISFESVSRYTSGDLAYDVGYYRIQIEEADGTRRPTSRGKFTTVWQRGIDGRWRISVDTFSPSPEETPIKSEQGQDAP